MFKCHRFQAGLSRTWSDSLARDNADIFLTFSRTRVLRRIYLSERIELRPEWVDIFAFEADCKSSMGLGSSSLIFFEIGNLNYYNIDCSYSQILMSG